MIPLLYSLIFYSVDYHYFLSSIEYLNFSVPVQNEAPAQQYILHTVTPPRTQTSPRAPAENILATSAPPSLSFIPENGVFTADLNNVVFHHPR